MYKVGIFGTGPLAKIHIDTWKELPDVSIAGFFALGNEGAAELENFTTLKRYAYEEELVQDCDLIDVICAASARFSICEKAIRKGKHVFVEKPMAYTMSEAEQLVKLVQESNVKLQVGHNERFNPAFSWLKGFEPNPMYIEARRMAHFNNQGNDVDVVFDLMIHDIDIVLSVVKSEVKQVSASGVAVVASTPDIANARIAFNNGCVANLTASRIEKATHHEMRLFLKDAYIELDSYNNRSKIVHLKERREEELSASSQEVPKYSRFNATRLELEEFLAAVRNNTRTAVNEIDGYRAMEVAHQIQQKITLNFPTTS